MVLKATKESLLSQQLTDLMSLTLPFFVLAVFDRKVLVGRPDVKGREAILRVHAKNKPLAQDVDLKLVAQQTPGFVGADLEMF